MPISTYPGASANGLENWVQIASGTPSSGSTYSINVPAGYKKIRLAAANITAGASYHKIRLNADSTSGNYLFYNNESGGSSLSASDGFNGPNTATNITFDVSFDFIQGAGPVRAAGWFAGSSYTGPLKGIYVASASITAISLTLGTGTFNNSGIIQLWGVAA